MHHGWFEIGGTSSEDIASFIRTKHEREKAKRVLTMDEVPGVSKLIPVDKGYYTNAAWSLSLFCKVGSREEIPHFENLLTSVFDCRGEYVDFIYFGDPTHKYQVIVTDIRVSDYRKTGLAIPYTVSMSVAPFKQKISQKMTFEYIKAFELHNPYFYKAEPYFKLYGSGNASLYINNRETKFQQIDQVIEIDSDPDIMEVWKEENKKIINQNEKFLSMEFPFFDTGKNTVRFSSNIKKIIVEPRWQTKI